MSEPDAYHERATLATSQDIAHALTQVLSLIATAERLSREHQLVNLSSLDRRVGALCAAIAALPGDEARRFAPGLTTLVQGLDRLEVATRDAHQALNAQQKTAGSGQITGLSESTRANAAYARALSVEPPPMAEPVRSGSERRRVERRQRDRRTGEDRRQGQRRDDE
ncbi:hypothetical protein [uncultured Rhodospira sp.]|uniref:hypothetical protein n=1 Tax=uncultured Rhodospira sp. TaxID=1936189 RepID=UPI00261695E9|nr:hypothetical protein [uncultured Rhodospira sp.]